MKRIDEMTREEINVLSDEEIQTSIDLEVAYAGIMPVPQPVYEDVPAIDLKKNDSCYKVHGCYLKSKEDAEVLSRMEICSETYDYQGGAGYDYKFLTDPETGVISIEKFYTRADVINISKVIKLKKSIEERNSVKRKEYNEYESRIKEIVDHVNCLVSSARDFYARVGLAKTVFEKHLKLAEGNRGIAVNFFKTAYSGQDEIISTVLSEQNITN